MQHGLPPGTHTSRSLVLGHELPTMSKAQPWGDACPEQFRGRPAPCPWALTESRSPAFSLPPPAL